MLDVDDLIGTAVRETGLEDFGGQAFREGLEHLVADVNGPAKLTTDGANIIQGLITGMLSHRLQVVDWAAGHPEVTAAEVERPLFVIGPPRTGTTLLSGLLHADPRRRAPLRWEAMRAVPPVQADALETDPRVAEEEASQLFMDALNPGFKAIHDEPATGPTECVSILAQDFRGLLFDVILEAPSYREWNLDCDHTSAYDYHRLQLQVMQSHARGWWTLKAPTHALTPEYILARYPDARFVVTHRDPVAVISSVCSFARSMRRVFSDVPFAAAEHWTRVVELSATRIADFRAAHPDVPVVDVRYPDLVADPVATMRRIYTEVGDPLSADTEARWAAYMQENPQGKFGRHEYSTAEFGLSTEAVRERFAGYTADWDL
ncbi:sulfotransferase family protein [Yinghuangia soli]|uniref:Sulfotransferase n=1 Tax=Yinghuangia soli TaxID=2908204 RepID=A0AA41PXK9_9ACTN|nr:sulfotransferase [Yinghuangia soli]MCF2526704.1 sulfotransferase [Yinghuangia soli]